MLSERSESRGWGLGRGNRSDDGKRLFIYELAKYVVVLCCLNEVSLGGGVWGGGTGRVEP